MSRVQRLSRLACRYRAETLGGATILSVVWLLLLVGLAGLAIDATNGYRHKAVLQATADAAALAAIIDLPDADAARATAHTYAEANLPPEQFGSVLEDRDLQIGRWDEKNGRLIVGGEPADAVGVTVRRSLMNGNPLGTAVLGLIGFNAWEVNASAIAMRFYPGCLSREGLISAKKVSMTSDTHYINGFCVHGAQGVSVTNGNSFEEGVSVTMEDLEDFEMPTGGFGSNPGLEAALGEDAYDLVILDLIDELVAALKDPTSRHQPSIVDPSLPAATEYRTAKSIREQGLAPNQVHYLPCNEVGDVLNLPADTVYTDVVIVTDCRISIGSKAKFHNVTMATTWSDPSSTAVGAASLVEWGRDDDCAPGGGARVLTPGAIKVSAQNRYFSGQFISRSTVSVSANADGGTGVSVISGEDISLTSSHGSMGLCEGVKTETPYFRAIYFRLVR